MVIKIEFNLLKGVQAPLRQVNDNNNTDTKLTLLNFICSVITSVEEINITNGFMTAFFQKISDHARASIRSITIEGVDIITAMLMNEISRCKRITDFRINDVNFPDVTNFKECLPNITSLDLGIYEETFFNRFEYCHDSLKHLCIESTNDSTVLTKLPKLETLQLTKYPPGPTFSLHNLFMELNTLKFFKSFTFITDQIKMSWTFQDRIIQNIDLDHYFTPYSFNFLSASDSFIVQNITHFRDRNRVEGMVKLFGELRDETKMKIVLNTDNRDALVDVVGNPWNLNMQGALPVNMQGAPVGAVPPAIAILLGVFQQAANGH